MKFSMFLVAVLAVVGVVAAADQPTVAQPALNTAAEALEKVQASELPNGVTLTGTTEKIDQPAGTAAAIAAKEGGDNNKDDKQEQYGWGMGLGGGWGNWGGWGGFGPYRFGFTCGGYPGWAYPMGYWNMFGAGLYGGSCSLGMPFGGLYYC
ncbi:hypothetical protein PF004_g25745 [Phytophthora fragariae]|uniref:Uncharacterized protein n=1 Tax=Phytophthora fragariae TaxID=53985 RepID=A0A6G0MS86_9STRA|nr:hypothetical protein PF004_g25745 [Phytophthora fragariae]